MIAGMHFSAEQLLEMLQEGDRWIELKSGKLARHVPPDDAHGNVVRNLAQALAVQTRQKPDLVACFDLGLILSRNPDTVRCPAISCFPLPSGFEESDKLITETCPRLVVEIASTNDRRTEIADRVKSYLEWGVQSVWVFDPVDRQVHLFAADRESRRLRDHETLSDSELIPGFHLRVAEAFADPKWMQPPPDRS